jgi:hypothetical protein
MKIILSSRRRHYVARLSIFLITVALIAGMVGCVGAKYDLTISSTEGGEVATPGEGTFTYDGGKVVNLVATPANGYRFVNWAGDIDTIASPVSATTNITMDGTKSVTANFALLGYNLAVHSTGGGSVITPGEGTFTYDEGTVVNLVAEAEEGYHFVNWAGDVDTIAGVNNAATTITMNDNYTITANFGEGSEYTHVVGAGLYHTVGVKSDGTVVAVGDKTEGQCDVARWTDIIRVAAGGHHTVGLKSDGTVVAVGLNFDGQCDVASWTHITQVAAGLYHTVGLRSDGTVVAVGLNFHGQCDVASWTDITQVAAGGYHTVGVKSDGTVVAVGDNADGQCDVASWADITQVAAGDYHTVGLKSDGTVVAVGDKTEGQCDVASWADIVQVAAGGPHTVGLKSDGTAVAVGFNWYRQCDVTGWTDIIQVAGGVVNTVGLKSDGTVVAVGLNFYGQCDVGDWMLW